MSQCASCRITTLTLPDSIEAGLCLPCRKTNERIKRGKEEPKLRAQLTAGLAAAKGAQVCIEHAWNNADPHDNDNYCRLVDWIAATEAMLKTVD